MGKEIFYQFARTEERRDRGWALSTLHRGERDHKMSAWRALLWPRFSLYCGDQKAIWPSDKALGVACATASTV